MDEEKNTLLLAIMGLGYSLLLSLKGLPHTHEPHTFCLSSQDYSQFKPLGGEKDAFSWCRNHLSVSTLCDAHSEGDRRQRRARLVYGGL